MAWKKSAKTKFLEDVADFAFNEQGVWPEEVRDRFGVCLITAKKALAELEVRGEVTQGGYKEICGTVRDGFYLPNY